MNETVLLASLTGGVSPIGPLEIMAQCWGPWLCWILPIVGALLMPLNTPSKTKPKQRSAATHHAQSNIHPAAPRADELINELIKPISKGVWSTCSVCGTRVKAGNMAKHMVKVHPRTVG